MPINKLIYLIFLSLFFLILFIFFSENIVDIGSILFVIFFTALLWKFNPQFSNILIAALFIRLFVIFIGYFITLPDSTSDAIYFEILAYEWSKDGFFSALSFYPGISSQFISWFISIFYSIFGRSHLLAQSLSLIFGISSILLLCLLANKLWGPHNAKKVGWFASLFPSLVLYSILILREVYVVFFLIIAMYGMVNWIKKNNIRSIILSIFGFIGAGFFHSALILGGIIFSFVVILRYFKDIFKNLLQLRLNIKILFIFIIFLIGISFYFSNNFTLPKIGNFDQLTDIQRIVDLQDENVKGGASYPSWTKINSSIEFFYKAPIRAIYFLFSPFLWDISKLSHLIGFFDGILYLLITYLIFLNRKIIWQKPEMRLILIILICYFFIFGVGVGNFGTGLRHRSKFVAGLILLAAPMLPKFVLFGKSKFH